MLPKVTGLFRMTKDTEIFQTQSGTSITKMGLAASEKYGDKETKLFIDAVAFGKTGEIISQYAGTKGTQILLTGKIQLEQWQDKNTGENRSKVSMVVDGFDFVSGQNQSQGQGQYNANQAAYQQQKPMPQPEFNDFDDSDVPF